MTKKPGLHVLLAVGKPKGPAPKAPWDSDDADAASDSSPDPTDAPVASSPSDAGSDVNAKLDQLIKEIADLKQALLGPDSAEHEAAESPAFEQAEETGSSSPSAS